MHEQIESQKKAMEEELITLENRLNRLRVLYDQYFMGIERLPPEMKRNELDKAFMRSKIPRSRNTATKFRFRSVRQRFTSLKSYWDRISRLIEEGRIRRGILGRVQSRTPGGILSETTSAKAETAGGQDPMEKQASLREAGQERRKALKQKKREREKRSVFNLSEVDDIYAALIRQKRAAGDDPGRMTRQALESNIEKLLSRTGDQDIRLKVVNREGKVALVAIKAQKET